VSDPGTQPFAVSVRDVSKAFRLPQEQMHTLKERALHPLRRTTYEQLDALQDVAFDVEPGEIFGIVGRNGSGKSTLLKCLAGIYRPDAGEIWLRGRMAPFIELGVGFNPELAARDNVVLNAVMLGLTPAEARARCDEVIAFAELEPFTELKLKNYSSGMHVRLAFAVMVQVDADILLIDEVLAVGDAAFQHKCHATLTGMRDEGRTILLVTHDMSAVERFCNRAMLLERGRMLELGDPRSVALHYNRVNFDNLAATGEDGTPAQMGDGAARLVKAWFEDGEGRVTDALEQGPPCSLHVLVEAVEAIHEPIFGVSLIDDQKRLVFATTTVWNHQSTGSFAPGDRVEFAVRFDNVLTPGRYFVTPFMAHEGHGDRLMDLREGFATVLVTGTRPNVAIVDLPHDITFTRVAAEGAPPRGAAESAAAPRGAAESAAAPRGAADSAAQGAPRVEAG
jgi:ABC-type polysaccharide/polyol phosphate transport system ATPase subunit